MITHRAQQHTEEIDRRRSATLTEVLNLASRERELKTVCCDMLPTANEPRLGGTCVITVDLLVLVQG